MSRHGHTPGRQRVLKKVVEIAASVAEAPLGATRVASNVPYLQSISSSLTVVPGDWFCGPATESQWTNHGSWRKGWRCSQARYII